MKYSIDDAQTLAVKNGGCCLSKKYSGNEKLRWRCKDGHEWDALFHTIKNGVWCPECAKDRIGKSSRKWSLDQLKAHARKRGGECLEGTFTSLAKKIKWKCAEGHEWHASGKNVIHNESWCPHCAGKAEMTIERLYMVAKARGGKCLASVCNGSLKNVKWQCSNGHTFMATPHHVISSGSWCRTCATSRGESFCRLAFETIFGARFPNTRPQWLRGSTGNKLELDGYNSNLKLAFEHHGIQHYSANNLRGKRGSHSAYLTLSARKKVDAEKRAICKDHGVTLIEIPEVPSMTKVEKLKETIIKKCRENGYPLPHNADQIEIDYSQAYACPSVNKTFLKYQLTAKEKGGELLSKTYKGAMEKHTWRCAKGHIWEATPANVTSRNSWCPHCAGRAILTIDMAHEIAAVRGGTCLSKSYKNSKLKLRWRCSEGHEWDACLANVKNQQQWCPVCKHKLIWAKRRKHHQNA